MKVRTGIPGTAGPLWPVAILCPDDTCGSKYFSTPWHVIFNQWQLSHIERKGNVSVILKEHKTQEGLFLNPLPICVTRWFRIQYQAHIWQTLNELARGTSKPLFYFLRQGFTTAEKMCFQRYRTGRLTHSTTNTQLSSTVTTSNCW